MKSSLQTKKASITRSLKEAVSLKGTLEKDSADKEIDSTSFGVTGLVCLIKDKAERMRKLLEGLQVETESYHTILEEAKLNIQKQEMNVTITSLYQARMRNYTIINIVNSS